VGGRLITGQQHDCLPYVIAIVSALSVGDPFIQDYHLDENQPGESGDEDDDVEGEDDNLDRQELQNLRNQTTLDKQKRKLIRKKYYQSQIVSIRQKKSFFKSGLTDYSSSLQKHAGLDPKSDILKFLNVVGAYEYAGATTKFCDDNFLRPKAMEDIRKLRRQLTNMVASNFPEINICVDPRMAPPSALQLKVLRQVITAGLIDCVAMRQDVLDTEGGKGLSFKNSNNVPYKLMWSNEIAYIHPSSILYGQAPPPVLVYSELFKGGRNWLKGVTAVEPKWLAKIGKSLCTFGRPLEYPYPK
jgi:ATP-dependent RNA helicase DHX37/DHR1